MFNFWKNNKDILAFLSFITLSVLALASVLASTLFFQNIFMTILSTVFLFMNSVMGIFLLYQMKQEIRVLSLEKDLVSVNQFKFENLFNQSLAPTLIVDKNLMITDRNDSYIETFGNEDQSLLNYIVNHNNKKLYIHILQKLEQKEKFEFDFEIHTEKEKKYFVANLNPYTSNEDEIFYLATFIDKTDSIIKNEQFKKIAQSALEVAKNKSEFMANMSHELRTPLNGIIGLSDALIDNLKDQENKENAKIIHESGQLLLQLINNILDFSKLEANKVELESIPFSLHALLESVRSTLNELAKRKGIELKINYDHQLKEKYLGDKVRLTQVLFNLVGNALKFTQEGHVEISVKEVLSQNESTQICFAVKDTGIGMNEAAQAKLFEAFTQADSTINRKFGGTGLGLSISKKIVELYNSKIEVESKVGEGSTFFFTISLPWAADDNDSKTNTKEVFNIENIPLSILVAEDNKVNQLVAKKLFKKIGYEIDMAENGKVAIEMALKNKYDVIFMDLQMPEVDGLEATKEIFEKLDFFDAPLIVAMTANTDEADKKICFDIGMNDFISKPIEVNRLKEVIFKHFKQLKKSA